MSEQVCGAKDVRSLYKSSQPHTYSRRWLCKSQCQWTLVHHRQRGVSSDRVVFSRGAPFWDPGRTYGQPVLCHRLLERAWASPCLEEVARGAGCAGKIGGGRW